MTKWQHIHEALFIFLLALIIMVLARCANPEPIGRFPMIFGDPTPSPSCTPIFDQLGAKCPKG